MASSSDLPILLDVSRLVWRTANNILPTGIDRTCIAYVRHFAPRGRAVLQLGSVTRVFSPSLSQELFEALLFADQQVAANRLKALAWRWVKRKLMGRERQGDITNSVYLNVGHTGLDKQGHNRWLRCSGVKPVYFVHDLIPITHPEYCRPGEDERHRKRVSALLSNGAGIISNSRDTLEELRLFANSQAAGKVPRAVLAPLGIETRFIASISQLPSASERPYFVMLGTIEGRKNHLMVLTLWADMARQLGPACPQLVIIGRRGWECEQAVDLLERSAAIREHVTELPSCDDATLDRYMRGARALLFPSFVEGYGLPLVEALATGTPVIASDLAVFRELAGDIPHYCSPIDGLGWSSAIKDYARDDSASRAAQLSRLSGWEAPSWAGHFTIVDEWLEQFRS